MRAGTAIFALALAGSASAAVVAVKDGSPTAIERLFGRALAQSEDSTTTTTMTVTSTTWETLTVTLAPASMSVLTSSSSTLASSTASPLVTSLNAPPPMSLSITSSSTTAPSTIGPLVTSLDATPINQHKGLIHQNDDIASTIVATVVVTVVAQPIVTIYVNPSNAEGFIARLPHVTKRDSKPQTVTSPAKRGILTASLITQFVTSTVPATTQTVRVTGTPPPVATGTRLETLAPAAMSNPIPSGVTVVTSTATSTSTVTADSPADYTGPGASSPLWPSGWTSTSTNSTTSFLNISTFSATGLSLSQTPSVVTTSFVLGSTVEITPLVIETSRSPTTTVELPTTTTEPPTTDVGLGSKGAVTSLVPGSGSSKTFDCGGLPVPVGMVVAMAACFGVALLL